MKVLVTGVAGRVGSSLALQLAKSGYDVRGTIRPNGKVAADSLRSNVEILEASLTDREEIERAVNGVDVVVHMAAQIPVGNTTIEEYYDINVGGTLRLLESSISQRRPVGRFVFASTDNTYDPANPKATPIAEDHPQLPGDYYGTSKVLCENLVKNYHKIHGLEYVILRLGSVLAPNEVPSWFRLGWVRDFLAAHVEAGSRSNLWQLFAGNANAVSIFDHAVGKRHKETAVALTGPDGSSWSVHLTDVRDVVHGTMLSMTHPDAANETFNLVGPCTTRFTDAASTLASRLDYDVIPVELPMKLDFELLCKKANDRIGYRPKWNYAEMLDAGLKERDTTEDFIPVN